MVDAVRCAIEVQSAMVDRNDLVEESDGSDGRRRQYRRAVGRDRGAGQDLSVGRRLPAGARKAELNDAARGATALSGLTERLTVPDRPIIAKSQAMRRRSDRELDVAL